MSADQWGRGYKNVIIKSVGNFLFGWKLICVMR
jgi:hypothetical protein